MDKKLPPGSTIGILETGQLAKMTSVAAATLGYRTCVYGPEEGCACDVATSSVIAPYDDRDALARFVAKCSVIVTEFENVPLDTLDLISELSRGVMPVYPSRRALEVSQDRRLEKLLARQLGIGTTDFWFVENHADLDKDISFPAIVKTARDGYDGKGQIRVHGRDELELAWKSLGYKHCVVEAFADFEHEFSVIIARDQEKKTAVYDAFKNSHHCGILRETIWPNKGLNSRQIITAGNIARWLADNLNVVGLLAVEMFHMPDGRLIFNELAPRPHNSGHVTIDCAVTSQFEQLVRIVAGWPLGSTDMVVPGQMINLIGNLRLVPDAISEDAKVHLYNKAPKPGRKIGHVTRQGY